jgi:hypothetical protein
MNIQIDIRDINRYIYHDVKSEVITYDYIACYSDSFPSIQFNVGDILDLPSFKHFLSKGELYYPDPSCSYLDMNLIVRAIDELIVTEIKHVFTDTHGYVLCLTCNTYNS